MIATDTQSEKSSTLNAADRCDKCGAQAYYRVTMPSMFDLLFCSHDFIFNQTKLKEVALEILDESHKLV